MLPEHEAILATPSENHVVLSKKPDYYEQLKSSCDSLLVGRDSLEQQLPRIRILALVPLQRNLQQPETNDGNK